MKIISLFLLFVLFPLNANAISLDNIIKDAISNNKDINIIKSEIEIKKLELSRDYLLDNPMIEFEIMDLSSSTFTFNDNMTRLQASISQKIPLPEKLNIKRNISSLKINNENYILNEKINEIKRDLKEYYYSYYYYKEGINILDNSKVLMESLLNVLNIKYSIGKASLKDILSLQLELILIKEEKINFLKEKERIIYKINNIIGKENYINDINYENIKISKKQISYDYLKNEYLKNRDINKLFENQIKVEEKNNNIAKLSNIPDLGLRLSYGITKEKFDIVSSGVNIELPLWFNEKEKSIIKETEEKINKSKLEYENFKFNISKEIKNTISEIKQLEELYDIYNNLVISNSKEIVKNLISDYEFGKTDFYFVIDNQKKIFNYRLKLLELISEHQKKISYLEYIIGRDLL